MYSKSRSFQAKGLSAYTAGPTVAASTLSGPSVPENNVASVRHGFRFLVQIKFNRNGKLKSSIENTFIMLYIDV